MARQPMPKALSSLQSVQRSYTSEFSVGEQLSGVELVSKELVSELRELVSKERGREPAVRQQPG
jgi:hypothetical protein